jgi:hypothetical protein
MAPTAGRSAAASATAAAGPTATAAGATASASAPSGAGGSAGLLAGGGGGAPPSAGPADVEFPGRQDAFQFRRLDLESVYRDTLRRGLFATNVNPEGSVVWVSEYLRYRVNQCSHEQAIDRILIQIRGGGVPAVCGQQPQPFPDRRDALDFRRRLEPIYRDTLREPIAQTYVDDEGDVIWTMEYLRYRLSGCGHTVAIQKILDQINGRGVQADCGGGPKPSPNPEPQVVVDFRMNPDPCPLRLDGTNTRTNCTFDASISQVPGTIRRYYWKLNEQFEQSTTNPVFGGWAISCGTLPTIRIQVSVRLTIETTQGDYSRAWPVFFENNNGC